MLVQCFMYCYSNICLIGRTDQFYQQEFDIRYSYFGKVLFEQSPTACTPESFEKKNTHYR